MDIRFPSQAAMPDSDVIVWGGDLSISNLVNAYRNGIFPWPFDPVAPIPWCSPDPRAILRFRELHVSRSLGRVWRRHSHRLSVDEAFDEVIEACASVPRRPEHGTWIFDDMVEAYSRLHRVGYAHSVEVWDGTELVGGLYGVCVDGVFSGESMFHRRPNAGKIALLHLLRLLESRGGEWIDIQELTDHMARMGAREVGRDEYLRLLEATRRRDLDLFPL